MEDSVRMASSRNPSSPWNPAEPLNVSPYDYEKQVVQWLKEAGCSLSDFKVHHRQVQSSVIGEFELDAIAEFSILNGLTIRILVECKRHSRPVGRDTVLSLEAKMRELAFHKAMIFSTSGFQSGALAFARDRGIACITFVGGDFSYSTRSEGHLTVGPRGVQPSYAGLFLDGDDSVIKVTTIRQGNIAELIEWILTERS